MDLLTYLPPLPSLLAIGGGVLALVWIYLGLFRYHFWTTRIPPLRAQVATAKGLSEDTPLAAAQYPAVLVVIPARNEAEVIAQTVRSVLTQDYPGAVHLVVVNDNSEDATAQIAEDAAAALLARDTATAATAHTETGEQAKAIATESQSLSPRHSRGQGQRHFTLVDGAPLPSQWSGKLWAVEQGVRAGFGVSDSAIAPNAAPSAAPAHTPDTTAPKDNAAATGTDTAAYLWLTDADIAHAPVVLAELVERAQADDRALVSRMARLCIDTPAERWMIPAFVYFFQLLYPFAAIARPGSGIHGAAGGCILLKSGYVSKIGGIASLRGALIDDCTLAAHVARAGGRLWLELTRSSHSLRGYGNAKGVSNMIARTAYTQLHYSPLRLCGTVLGLFFVFWGPPLILLGSAAALYTAAGAAAPAPLIATAETCSAMAGCSPFVLAAVGSAVAFATMIATFVPMLRFYRLSPLRALALPVIATFYLGATLKSAVRYYRGKTGNWKGRTYQS